MRCEEVRGIALIVFVLATSLAFAAGAREEGVLIVILLLSGVSGLITGLLYKRPIQVTTFDALRGKLYLRFANPEFRKLVYERVLEKPETPDFSFLHDPEGG